MQANFRFLDEKLLFIKIWSREEKNETFCTLHAFIQDPEHNILIIVQQLFIKNLKKSIHLVEVSEKICA